LAVVQLRKYIKRYTSLRYASKALKTHTLLLPKPSKWDDLNDQHFVELYRNHVSAESVYALCCTMGAERYHHWRVFADGVTGVCLEFERAPFQHALNRMNGVRAGPVKYLKMNELNPAEGYRAEDLPFIKRIGYRDEREWRVLVTSADKNSDFFEIPFEQHWIHRIILNPWISASDAESARRTLRPLVEGSTSISGSFLRNSKKWKVLGEALVR